MRRSSTAAFLLHGIAVPGPSSAGLAALQPSSASASTREGFSGCALSKRLIFGHRKQIGPAGRRRIASLRLQRDPRGRVIELRRRRANEPESVATGCM
ncbi:hypothetical protein GALMADRAFT_254706 [Galerina marginata CBS 339.88]|uniref:Uncharacterized protein n=1 Tax=Galerina marginata (strain CBS 339.88) TaxID=685588 RepID=A0A067SI90_GALM3|nr:hypothetical protein GALMADRAFT_254706 [Galerina marginata CBS 339.88]